MLILNTQFFLLFYVLLKAPIIINSCVGIAINRRWPDVQKKGQKCGKLFSIPLFLFPPSPCTHVCGCTYAHTHSNIHYMQSKTLHLYFSLELCGMYLLFIELATAIFRQSPPKVQLWCIKMCACTHHCHHLPLIHSGGGEYIQPGFHKHNMADLCLGQVYSVGLCENIAGMVIILGSLQGIKLSESHHTQHQHRKP